MTGKSYSGDALDLNGVGGPVDLALTGSGLTSVSDFHFVVDTIADTTTIETATPCYSRGTMILTNRGQQRVRAEDRRYRDNRLWRAAADQVDRQTQL